MERELNARVAISGAHGAYADQINGIYEQQSGDVGDCTYLKVQSTASTSQSPEPMFLYHHKSQMQWIITNQTGLSQCQGVAYIHCCPVVAPYHESLVGRWFVYTGDEWRTQSTLMVRWLASMPPPLPLPYSHSHTTIENGKGLTDLSSPYPSELVRSDSNTSNNSVSISAASETLFSMQSSMATTALILSSPDHAPVPPPPTSDSPDSAVLASVTGKRSEAEAKTKAKTSKSENANSSSSSSNFPPKKQKVAVDASEVNKVINVVGDINERSRCDVVFKHKNGDVRKVNLVKSGIMSTAQFAAFCEANKHFKPLMYKPGAETKRAQATLIKFFEGQPFHAPVGTSFYTNLMSWNMWDPQTQSDWYSTLGLSDEIMYMVPGKVISNKAGNKFEIEFPYLNPGEKLLRDASYMHYEAQGGLHENQVAITPQFLIDNSQIFDEDTRAASVARMKAIIAKSKK